MGFFLCLNQIYELHTLQFHQSVCILVWTSYSTVKPVLSGHSKKTKQGFQGRLSLNAGQSIAECSPWSILQYFRPSLSYYFSFISLFSLFLSGRFRQVLQYCYTLFKCLLLPPLNTHDVIQYGTRDLFMV